MLLSELTDQVETVSRSYAEDHDFVRDDAWFVLKLHEELGEVTQAYLSRSGQGRDRGRTPEELDAEFRSELSDVLAHTLLLARRFDVDLEAELERKWLWRLRPASPQA